MKEKKALATLIPLFALTFLSLFAFPASSSEISISVAPAEGPPGAEIKVTVEGVTLPPEVEPPFTPEPVDIGPVYMGKLDAEDKMVEKYNLAPVWDDDKGRPVDWKIVDREGGKIERMYTVKGQIYAGDWWVFIGLDPWNRTVSAKTPFKVVGSTPSPSPPSPDLPLELSLFGRVFVPEEYSKPLEDVEVKIWWDPFEEKGKLIREVAADQTPKVRIPMSGVLMLEIPIDTFTNLLKLMESE